MLRAVPAISIFLKADEEAPLLLPTSPPPKQGLLFYYFIIYFSNIEIWQDIFQNSIIMFEFTL